MQADSAASERDRALRDRAIANTFEGRNVMEPRADVPIPDAPLPEEPCYPDCRDCMKAGRCLDPSPQQAERV